MVWYSMSRQWTIQADVGEELWKWASEQAEADGRSLSGWTRRQLELLRARSKSGKKPPPKNPG